MKNSKERNLPQVPNNTEELKKLKTSATNHMRSQSQFISHKTTLNS